VVGISRVCSEQQSSHCNQGFAFHGKLSKRIENGRDIRKREKVEKATKFVERIKKVHKEVGAALKKVQEDMKRQADRERKETKDWKKEDRVLLSTKDLVFKERPVIKLVDQYVGPYTIEEMVPTNAVKL